MTDREDSKFISEFLDKTTEFLTKEDDRDLAEIKKDLLAEGIDPERMIQRVRQLVAQKFEEHRLAWRNKARKERLAALQQVQNVKPDLTSLEIVRNKINALLRLPHGEKAELQLQTYHRKLETVTENDLKGILKDLECLKLLDDSSSKKY